MKGILIKDSYVVWGYGKSLFVICGFFLLISLFSPDVDFTYLIGALFSMLTVTSLSIDERCGWDKYVNVLPVSRKQVVLAKYLLNWILVAVSSVLVSVITAVVEYAQYHSFPENILENGFCMAALALLYSALCLPIIFRYGVEKGRLFYMFFMAFLAFFMSFVSRFLSEDVSMLSGGFFGVILFGIAVVCSGISFGLSIWLYKKKEF